MSGKVFAEKNAGRKVRVYVSKAGPNHRVIRYPFCYVVGYDDHNDQIIYVEFDEPQLHAYCIASDLVHTMVRLAPTNDTRKGFVKAMSYEHVRFLRAVKKAYKPKPVKPYPHKCSKCQSPARRISNYVLCSNNKCMSNKTFKKAIMAKVPKLQRIRCKVCRGYAIEVGAARGPDKTPVWRFSCAKKHTWSYEPKENDIVSKALARADQRDFIWKKNAWQPL